MPARSLTYTVEVKPVATWNTIASGSIMEDGISGDFTVGSSGDNPLAFSDSADCQHSITILRSAVPSPWYLTPIRITYTFSDTGAAKAFNGLIVGRDGDMTTVTLQCNGFAELIRTTRAYSTVFYRRKPFTATSASSVDDPASGSYRAGLGNWALWQAGGRPYEQAASYPTAKFYYSCDAAPIESTYPWVAGDNGWEQLQRLVQDGGGQIYQDEDGVVRYKSPLSFGSGSAVATLDESVYADVRETYPDSAAWATGAIIVPYVGREIAPQQEVIDDTKARLIAPSSTLTFDLEPKLPLWSLVTSGETCNQGFIVTYLSGEPAAATTDYTRSITWSAQKITISIVNPNATPLILHKLTLYGKPIVAGEAGSYTLGTHVDGVPDRNGPDSEFIQNIVQAKRVANLIQTFYGAIRPFYELTGCPYSNGIRIGDAVNFTCSALGYTNKRSLVIGRNHSGVAGEVNYTITPVDDLPTNNDLFLTGTTYSGTDTRKLGY